MIRALAVVLALAVIAQGIVISRLRESAWVEAGLREAAGRSQRAALERRDSEIAALVARLRAAEARVAALTPPPPPPAAEAEGAAAGSILLAHALNTQVAFSYGTPREAGRYVGQTLQRLFAATRKQDPEEMERSLRENELNLLSMGPFIKDAEQLESDPAIFAEFQSSLLAEVFSWDDARRSQARELIRGVKAGVASEDVGTEAWNAANRQATQQLVGLLTPEEQLARQSEIDFINNYGVLIVPTYSILTK